MDFVVGSQYRADEKGIGSMLSELPSLVNQTRLECTMIHTLSPLVSRS